MGKTIKQGDNYLSIDGLRVHVRCAGEGKPLVLLHGLGGPLMWQRVIEPLASHFLVITIDLPGFGDSECPQQPFSTKDYAELLFLLLKELNIRKAEIVGVSYGGQIAVEFATWYRDEVEQLVLIASTGLAPRSSVLIFPSVWPAIAAITTTTLLRNRRAMCFLSSYSFHDIVSRPSGLCADFYRQISRRGCRGVWMQMLKNILSADDTFSKKLGDLHVPTLLLWGESDRSVPLRIAGKFQQLIPSAVLQTFPHCAHSVPLEKPKELCSAIVRFVQEN